MEKILSLITIGILGTLSYFGYNFFIGKNIQKKYTNTADSFEQKILFDTYYVSNNSDKTEKYMEDYEIIGTIEIPKTKLKCPILNETTPRSLELAVAVMYPLYSNVNVPGKNIVIYGHNYKNSEFFSKNKSLVNGDKIYILDKDGRRVTYEVYETFETDNTDTSFYTMVSDENKCEITLLTSTDDASSTERRTIVRAREL